MWADQLERSVTATALGSIARIPSAHGIAHLSVFPFRGATASEATDYQPDKKPDVLLCVPTKHIFIRRAKCLRLSCFIHACTFHRRKPHRSGENQSALGLVGLQISAQTGHENTP
jgi:hypothetical protein